LQPTLYAARLRRTAQRLLQDMLQTLYGPRCPLSGVALPLYALPMGAEAWALLPPTGQHLHPGPNDLTERLDSSLFRAAYAGYWYHRGATRRLVHMTKYEGQPELGRLAARRWGHELWQAGILGPGDVLVPLPLHWYRRWRRGYNQAEILAQGLAEASGARVAHHALRRTRHTRQQSRLNAEARLRNVQGAFAVDELPACGRIWLVDDVITTGSTLTQAAKALHQAGAPWVGCLALAMAE
jgi:ComF family protein